MPIPLPKTGLTADEKRDAAAAALETFCTGDDVVRWALTRRFLHTFSLRNQILLLMQIEERCTMGAADSGWNALALSVNDFYPIQAIYRWRKTEFFPARTETLPGPLQGALWVLAPQTKAKGKNGLWTCQTCAAVTSGPRCSRGHPRPTVFAWKPVFARLQVVNADGEPPPQAPAPAPLSGDSHGALWAPLAAWGRSELQLREIRLKTPEEDAVLARAGGYYDDRAKRIVVRRDGDGRTIRNVEVATLIHELAHACGVGYEGYGRQQAEAIVESAAMLACAALGLDISMRSMAYVASWAGAEGEEPWATLQFHMKIIDTLARRIERAAIYPPEEDT